MSLGPALARLGQVGGRLRTAFAVPAVHTDRVTGATTSATVRIQRASGSELPLPTDRRQVLRAVLHVAQDVVATPQQGDAWALSAGAFAGTWYQDGPAEPCASGDWRCPLVQEAIDQTLVPAAGWPGVA